jgi:hypothetical protein
MNERLDVQLREHLLDKLLQRLDGDGLERLYLLLRRIHPLLNGVESEVIGEVEGLRELGVLPVSFQLSGMKEEEERGQAD